MENSIKNQKLNCPIFYKYLGQIMKVEYPYTNSYGVRELLNMLDLDEIINNLSPKYNTSYKTIQLQIINSIPNTTPELYLKFKNAGFTVTSLFHFALRLIENCKDLDEFKKYEHDIYEPQFENTWTGCFVLFKTKILENSTFSYDFIINYLDPKYPELFKNVSKFKIAIAKGYMPGIYDNYLELTPDETNKINYKYCTASNIDSNKWFAWDFSLKDFINANKTTTDENINYATYLPYFTKDNIKTKHLQTNLDKFPTGVIQQLLPYIIVEPETLAKCPISLSDKLTYIDKRIKSREYSTSDFLLFIAIISDNDEIDMNNYEYLESQSPPSLIWPWSQLATYHRAYIRHNPVHWEKIRYYINPSNSFNLYSYLKFLKLQPDNKNWDPDIQIEFWTIIKNPEINSWISNSEKSRLLEMCPIQYILEQPLEEILKYKLYRHSGFSYVLKTNSSLKTEFAALIINQQTNYNINKKELEFLLKNVFTPQDVLEYFRMPDYVQVIYEYSFYDKFPSNVLRELIPLCYNTTMQHTFYHALSIKTRQEKEAEQRESFIKTFNQVNIKLYPSKPYDILMEVINEYSIKNWTEDNYKYAIKYHSNQFNLDILQSINNNFTSATYPRRPEFNWSIITKLLGTDQNILKYPDLPWVTPLYFAHDNYWISKAFYYEFVIDHTFLFSTDSAIWTEFSKSLPMNFIFSHSSYMFKWSDIISRPDFKVSNENWPILKEYLLQKDIYNITPHTPIEIILNNLNMNWNWRFIFESLYVKMQYLPSLLTIYDNMTKMNSLPIMCTLNNKHLEYIRNSIFIRSIIYDFDKFKEIISGIQENFCQKSHIGDLVIDFFLSKLINNSN